MTQAPNTSQAPRLLIEHPVYAEWHPTRNVDLDPSTITRGQHVRAWWLCLTCSHEWQATVIARARPTRPSGCPACSRKQAAQQQAARGAARNPLSEHPVATELHPTKNGPALDATTLAASSRQHLWWLCPTCGHEWEARAAHRTDPARNSGCPQCAAQRVGERRASETAKVNPLSAHPISAEFHPTLNGDLTPEALAAGARQAIWWKCSTCSHEWQAKVTNRTRQAASGCPACVGRARSAEVRGASIMPRETLAAHPISVEFHPTRNGAVDPGELTCGSHRVVWWRCPKGHEWQSEVANRAKRSRPAGCPGCAQEIKSLLARSVAAAANPLSAHHVAAEFHPTRNGTLTSERVSVASGLRVWWKCSTCSHEWQGVVSSRTTGKQTGCPRCGHDIISATRYAQAASRNPLSAHQVAAQFHPTKNGTLHAEDISVGSHRLVWWLCPTGHEYEAIPQHRTRADRPTGCPICGAAAAGEAVRQIRATRHWSSRR